jgi:hypothetical protein
MSVGAAQSDSLDLPAPAVMRCPLLSKAEARSVASGSGKRCDLLTGDESLVRLNYRRERGAVVDGAGTEAA